MSRGLFDFNQIQAVFFDLDGTLLDTAPDLGAAADKMRLDRGMPPLPAHHYRPLAGSGARGMIAVAFGLAPEQDGFEALKEAGLSIPEDISVVGYDDEEISRHLHPRLTTSILPHRAMGQWAIERLGEPFDPSQKRYPITKLECSLVSRDSVAEIKRFLKSAPPR